MALLLLLEECYSEEVCKIKYSCLILRFVNYFITLPSRSVNLLYLQEIFFCLSISLVLGVRIVTTAQKDVNGKKPARSGVGVEETRALLLSGLL